MQIFLIASYPELMDESAAAILPATDRQETDLELLSRERLKHKN